MLGFRTAALRISVAKRCLCYSPTLDFPFFPTKCPLLKIGESRSLRNLSTGGNEDPSKAKGFPKIYTKTGDSGMTSTFTGERRAKDDAIFQALGAIDELTSLIGVAREFGLEGCHPYTDHLQRIQCILQDVNACVATPLSSARESHIFKTEFDSSHVGEVEEWIDSYTSHLPPLENFILPGGGKASSTLHVARTVCRRAERAVVPLVRGKEVNPETLRYLNRLSDLLFTLARYAAKLDGRQETVYLRPGKK